LRAALEAHQRFVLPHEGPLAGHRRAAVLVPLLVRDHALRLVFTRRSADLRVQPGQICFPGGRAEEGDAHIMATSIREAEEEIGIDPAAVKVLGLLSDIGTSIGYLITPVVAQLAPPPERYRLAPAEVAAVFEVPVAQLRAPGVMSVVGEVERWGRRIEMYAYRLEVAEVVGATARMVHELLEVLS
jgi:8-oxo-dGTP pyrophosphatase MutT (NUDIX family)